MGRPKAITCEACGRRLLAAEFEADARRLVADWWTVAGSVPLLAGEVFDRAELAGLGFAGLLTGRTRHARVVSFTRSVLVPLVGSEVGRCVVRRVPTGKGARYWLEKIS